MYGPDNAGNVLMLIHRCIELCTAHREVLSEALNEISLKDRQDIYNYLVLKFSPAQNDELLNEKFVHANCEPLKDVIEYMSTFTGLSNPFTSPSPPSTAP